MPPASSSSSPSSTTDNRTSTNGCSTGDDPPPFYRNASHSEIFEDIESRFIVNLPPDEIVAPERISFQIEQAHWFYEDFVREENPHLKSYSLKEFTATLIKQSDILAHFADNPLALYETFLQYKSRVPVCGAIMLNDKWDSCILVRGYSKGAGWGFPKGKINEGEAPETCAVREVLEETGYNMQGQIDVRDRLQKNMKGQSITLFIVPNVPSHFEFQTRTRKEIGEIRWFKLVDLPGWNRNQHAPAGKYYLITPFMSELQKFVHDRKPRKNPQQKQAPRTAPTPRSQYSDSSDTNSDHNRGPETPSPQASTISPQVVVNTTNQIVPLPLSVLFDSAGGSTIEPVAEVHPVPVSSKNPPNIVTTQPTLPPSELSKLSLVAAPEQPQPHSPVSATSSFHSSSTTSSSNTSSSAKALALLETVAGESAAMDRFFREQTATPSPALRPAPPASVPLPSPLLYHQQPQDVLYSSGPAMRPPVIANLPPPFYDVPRPTTTVPAPYIRPSTSQMYQRPPPYPAPGSMSMSQSQILDVMHSPHSYHFSGRPPLSPHLMHASATPAAGGFYPPLSQPVFGPPSVPGHPTHTPSYAPAPSSVHPLPPLSAPAYPITFPGHAPQPPPERTASLLSILNGGI